MFIQPKLNEISIYQHASKMLFFKENHKFKIFVEVSTLVEYSIQSQNFFLKSKYPIEHFYFLNHVHLSKIEKISTPHLPPKTPKKGG